MCEHGKTEPVTVKGTAHSIWEDVPVDACIAPVVDALNHFNIHTAASCCGHGKGPGNIALHDGRELIIARDYDDARRIEQSCYEMAAAEATIEQLQISRAGWKDRAEKAEAHALAVEAEFENEPTWALVNEWKARTEEAEKRIAELRGRFVTLVEYLGGDGGSVIQWNNHRLAHDSNDPTDKALADAVLSMSRMQDEHTRECGKRALASALTTLRRIGVVSVGNAYCERDELYEALSEITDLVDAELAKHEKESDNG